MKNFKFILIAILVVMAITACGASPVVQTEAPVAGVQEPTSISNETPEAPAQDTGGTVSIVSEYENALSLRQILALGTLQLEQSSSPITSEQAPQLLMLWQGLDNLTNSGTAAEAEINALLAQIESTLNQEQIKLINEMRLTQVEIQAWAQENGITQGTGTGTGMGQGQGSNLSAEEKATRQALNNPTGDTSNRENSLSSMLTQKLIEYLESKSK